MSKGNKVFRLANQLAASRCQRADRAESALPEYGQSVYNFIFESITLFSLNTSRFIII